MIGGKLQWFSLLFLYDTGIYGHSAVYYSTKGIILVFGGYRFRIHTVSASDELYSLDLATNKWSILEALPHNEVSLKYLTLTFNQEKRKKVLAVVFLGIVLACLKR